MELARDAVVSEDPPPLFLYFKAGGKYGCYVAGAFYPENFDGALTNALPHSDVHHGFDWKYISQALLFLDRDQPRTGGEPLEEPVVPEPPEFASLRPQEILRMLHVQLRLSCCGVAEVQGPMNEAGQRLTTQDMCSLRVLPLVLSDSSTSWFHQYWYPISIGSIP